MNSGVNELTIQLHVFCTMVHTKIHIFISTDNFVLGESLNFMHMKETNSTVSFYVVYLDCFLSPSDCQCTSGRNSLEHGLYRWVIVNKACAAYSYGHWSDYRDIVPIKFE